MGLRSKRTTIAWFKIIFLSQFAPN